MKTVNINGNIIEFSIKSEGRKKSYSLAVNGEIVDTETGLTGNGILLRGQKMFENVCLNIINQD